MKKFVGKNPVTCYGLILLVTAVIGCDYLEEDGGEIIPERVRALTEEASRNHHQIISFTQEMLDGTAEVLSEEGLFNGIGTPGGRFGGCVPAILRSYAVDSSHYDTLIYAGKIMMDYGSSSCSFTSKTRMGKIINAFTCIVPSRGARTFAMEEKITFENFRMDTVWISGSFHVRSAAGRQTDITTEGIKILYGDLSSVIWKGKLLANRGALSGHERVLGGSGGGTTRKGAYFTAAITRDLVYNDACLDDKGLVPVSGVVEISINRSVTTLDYGRGDCDRIYTATSLGETVERSF